MNSSFASVSAQILNYNNNVLELLSKLNTIMTASDSSVKFDFTDQFGVLTTYDIPSFGYLLGEIKRLSNNLNTIYNIDSPNGTYIQTSNSNQFKKIVSINLNKEPKNVTEVNIINTFEANYNNFFDGLLNPMLKVTIDLNDKIDNYIRKVLVRRYIVSFERDETGVLTSAGQSALASFNNTFKGKNNVTLLDFTTWHSTTNGVLTPNYPYYDQETFDLEPNEVLYDGMFSVLKTEEDSLNKKIWYHLNTLDYLVVKTKEKKQLKVGDELLLNTEQTSTKYSIIEVSLSASNPRIRVQTVEGVEPIPVLVNALKINTPLLYNKNVKVSIGHDERCVLFVKPLNTDLNLLSKDWSLGSGFWTNELVLTSTTSDNGKTLSDYYAQTVYDYGEVLNDLVKKRIPTKLGEKPNSPTLVPENFKVIQINAHLTDNKDTKEITKKYAVQKELKSEIAQLDQAIKSKSKELRATGVLNNSVELTTTADLKKLVDAKSSKTSLLQSTIGEIIALSTNPNINNIQPKYRLRGFWDMPLAKIVSGSQPQEVIQFKVQYKYVSKDGNEAPVNTYSIIKNDNTLKSNAAFSNWNEYISDVRKRVYNPIKDVYEWVIEDVSDADTPNINQLDLAIQPNEAIEIRIKSISEVGYPESPMESDWSESITIQFPDNLSDVLNENQFILKEASQEDLVIKVKNELGNVEEHVSNQTVIGNRTYYHTADKILSGIKDSNSVELSVYEFMVNLSNEVKSLKEQIERTRGILQVSIFRNKEEYLVKSDSVLTFNIECEDYLTQYTGETNGRSGRVYTNSIYTVKDFYVKIKNVAASSPLGLSTNRSYDYSGFYSSNVPQVFWTNDRDELLYSNLTGVSTTQLNNQFIWMTNFDEKTTTITSGLANNIGNSFQTSNSITDKLAQAEYNIGYTQPNELLSFKDDNNSLMDIDKWSDINPTIASNEKLLSTIHPSVQNLEDLVEKNADSIKTLKASQEFIIPLNIYFKINSIDPSKGDGVNYDFVDLNNAKKSTKHTKKLKFYLENEADNKPFVFKVVFNINRNKVSQGRLAPDTATFKPSGNFFTPNQ